MIELVKWYNHFSVGSDLIDSQHKQLVKMLNELYTAYKKKEKREALQKIVLELKQYTVFHFKSEEKLMEEINYTDLPEHKIEHQQFVEKVLDFEKKLEKMKPSLIFEMLMFLRQWLSHHILEVDMMYKPYLTQKQEI